MKRVPVALAVVAFVLVAVNASAQGTTRPDDPRPIDAVESLWTEELTWMEMRDAVKAGKTTVIIGTGGVEQNGPYVAGGKHNYVLQATLPAIAARLGNALIAPIVKFVPEGRIEPEPSGHMRFAGTISLEQATFEALLTDICRSYKQHGFTDIILVGDSGGNQTGMRNVAQALNAKWAGERARVHYLAEYYNEDRWSYDYFKKLGVVQMPDVRSDSRNGIHDDVHYEAIIALTDPKLIRMEQRMKKNLFSLHGVELAPIEKTLEIGRKLVDYRAAITVEAFRKSQQTLREKN